MKMSDHLRIKGNVDLMGHESAIFFNDKHAFCYCKHCKANVKNMAIEVHQGITGVWFSGICGICNRTIWATTSDYDDFEYIKNNKKCSVCKKLTNAYDCVSYGTSFKKKRKDFYLCSSKCYKKWKD